MLSRLLEAHELVMIGARGGGRTAPTSSATTAPTTCWSPRCCAPTSSQTWFVSEHLVDTPLVNA